MAHLIVPVFLIICMNFAISDRIQTNLLPLNSLATNGNVIPYVSQSTPQYQYQYLSYPTVKLQNQPTASAIGVGGGWSPPELGSNGEIGFSNYPNIETIILGPGGVEGSTLYAISPGQPETVLQSSATSLGSSQLPVSATIPINMLSSPSGIINTGGISGTIFPVSSTLSKTVSSTGLHGNLGSNFGIDKSHVRNPVLAYIVPSVGSASGVLSNPGKPLALTQSNGQPTSATILSGVGGTGANIYEGGFGATGPSVSNVGTVGILQQPNWQATGMVMSNSHGSGTSSQASHQLDKSSPVIQVPCLLQVLGQASLTLPQATGITQGTQSGISASNSAIPSSFVDSSPPTVGILRPPSEASNNYRQPLSASHLLTVSAEGGEEDSSSSSSSFSSSSKKTKTVVKTTTSNLGQVGAVRSEANKDLEEELVGQPEANDASLQSVGNLARNGFPIVYTILPPTTIQSGINADTSSSFSASASKGKTSPSMSSARPSRGKNPYFNVNKRKHFEFYQYF